MSAIPAKVAERLRTGLKRFQAVISSARARDVNESDTVTIVTDLLSELFGYDKYAEITSEHAIRGTYCDLAVKVDGQIRFIIEVKAIGIEFKDAHVKQAVDYAANQGVEWVILTNAMHWHVYRISFGKPIGQECIFELDLLNLNFRSSPDVEMLFLLSREGLAKSMLEEYHTQKQATNRFLLGAIILTEPVVQVIRRELKRLAPDVKIAIDEIKTAITQEVLKREVVEGEEADEARKKVQKSGAKGTSLRRRLPKDSDVASIAADNNDHRSAISATEVSE